MVTIFTGTGAGFERGSGNVVGGSGLLGSAALGRSGEQLMLNAANGNLLIAQQDEFLVGRGPDAAISRTYNSLGDLSDDNGDNWRQSTDRRVYGLVGTVNTFGSTVKRVAGDGSVVTYRYNGSGYASTDGSGASDKLAFANSVWTWTDGDSQTVETYGYSYGRASYVTQQADIDGNALTYAYSADKLTSVTTANGEQVLYQWSGNNLVGVTNRITPDEPVATFNKQIHRLYDAALDHGPDFYGFYYHLARMESGRTFEQVAADFYYSAEYQARNVEAMSNEQYISFLYQSVLRRTGSAGEVQPWTNVLNGGSSRSSVLAAFSESAEHVNLSNATPGRSAPPFIDVSRTRYDYDSYNRLASVSVDLTPDDNNIADGNRYVTTYTYVGTSRLVASIAQTDGSRIDVGYDAANRVVSLTQAVDGSAMRVTSVAYNADYTVVTDPTGQATRLDYAAVDFAGLLDSWSSNNLGKESVVSNGSAATKYTVQTGGQWSGIAKSFNVAAGDTIAFGTTLQAVGDVTSQSLSLYSEQTEWGPQGVSTARIVSGPGSLEQGLGGFWRVIGLSSTVATRVEITRTYEQSGIGDAYIYVDHPGNYHAGASLIVKDPTLLRSTTASAADRRDLGTWTTANLDRTTANTSDGVTGYKYAVKTAGDTSTIGKRLTVKAGETYDFSFTIQAVGAYTNHSFGLDSDAKGWGTTALSSARIVSGPGTLTQNTGGSFKITGLSSTQATRVVVTRTYDADGAADARFYVDLANNERVGAAAILSGIDVTKRLVEPAAAGQLLKITAPPAASGAAQQVTQFAYTANGDLASIVDPAGATTSFTYDAAGNRLSTTDRLGAVTSTAYTAINQVKSQTRNGVDADAGGSLVDRYVYDAKNRVHYAISAQGRVMQYFYTTTGQLSRTEQYTGSLYAVTGTPLDADMAAWVSGLVDKSARIIANYSYGARGNLTSTTTYAAADANGTELTTAGFRRDSYVYDQAGRLLYRTIGSMGQEHVLYDGLGRTIASFDAAGGATRFAFSDAAQQTIVTLASGLVQTSTFDKAGGLLSVAEAGYYATVGTASYKYDALGRMRVATDATGNKSYVLYDKAGRKIGDVDQLGTLTEYRYDALDRLVATGRYATALTSAQLTTLADPNANVDVASLRPAANAADLWTWKIYDKEGRLVQTIDGTGAVVANSYDASGSLARTTSYFKRLTSVAAYITTPPTAIVTVGTDAARDIVERTFYDRDRNVVGTLDGEGYLTRLRYDAAGNLIEQTQFATVVPSANRAAGTFNQLVAAVGTTAGDRTVRHVRDGQGHIRFTIDALNHVTEFVYATGAQGDAIDAVRQTIAHAVAIATPSSYTVASVRAALDAVNASTNPARRQSFAVYDPAGRLAYEIAATGAVTGYGYDAAGNIVKTLRYAAVFAASAPPAHATMLDWSASVAGNPENRVTRSFYSARDGELRFVVDALGYATRYDYDAEGRQTATVRFDTALAGVDDASTTATVASRATGSSVTTSTVYDADGRVSKSIDANGTVTFNQYNINGTLASVSEAYGTTDAVRTTFAYDAAGRVTTKLLDADGSRGPTKFTYDAFGNVTSEEGWDGFSKTAYSYDRGGNVLRVLDALGGLRSYEYNGFGDQVKATDERLGVTYTYYTSLGQVRAVRDAENHVTETTYTLFGEVETLTRRASRAIDTPSTATLPIVAADGRDATTIYAYDMLGRLTSVRDAEGGSEATTYNTFGEVRSFRSKINGTTTYIYDSNGRRTVEHSDALVAGAEWRGGYDVHSYTYDARGNVLSDDVNYFEGGVSSAMRYRYDAANQLVEKTGWPVSIGLPGASATVVPTETYSYDKRGNLKRVVDANGGATTFYYNGLDLKTAEVDATGALMDYSYNSNGYMTGKRAYATRVTVPPSLTTKPSGGSTFRLVSYTNDVLGRQTGTSIANLRTGSWSGTGFVTGTGTVAESTTYDASGNIVKATDGAGGSVLSYYDLLNRKVAQVDQAGYLTEWTLDAAGNAVSERRYAAPVTGATALSKPVGTTSTDDRVTNFTYDRNGRRLTEERLDVEAARIDTLTGAMTTATGSAIVRYTYNAAGQVTTKREATGDTTHYDYDSAGRLVRETRAALKPANQDDDAVTPVLTYAYDGAGNLVRTEQGEVLQLGSGYNRVTTNAYDEGGRLTSTTDALGQVRSYRYDRAGNRIGESYVRQLSDGRTKTEGVIYRYDAVGRLIYQNQVSIAGTTWTEAGVAAGIGYSVFGEIVSRAAGGIVQERIDYDDAGRVWRTTAGDGVWRYFLYDAAGRRTATLESDGATDLRNKTLDQVIAAATGDGANTIGATMTGVTVTIAVYDARGQATATRAPQRRLDQNGTVAELVTQQGYTAFGEVASQTDARGYVTRFTYNRMGRATVVTRPQVAVTGEDGQTVTRSPVEYSYYDISGRQVATRDANGALTTRMLAGGTGYGDTEALVSTEWHADGGRIVNRYDAFGQVIRQVDAVDRTRYLSYDLLGRLVQDVSPGNQIESYGYDVLGQRLWHADAYLSATYGAGERETSDYDIAGRVVSTRSFGGDVTTTAYSWSATAAASGIGVLGTWTAVTRDASGHESAVQSDLLGHVVAESDTGGAQTLYTYDLAGRMATRAGQGETVRYAWYNSGLLKSQASDARGAVSTYGYDAGGHLMREQYSQDGVLYQDASATWDAAGRMATWSQGSAALPAATMAWQYDAVGNIRHTVSTRVTLDAFGAATGSASADRWYRFDTMGRVTLDGGTLVSGVIARGTGTTLTYDAGGQRMSATRDVTATGMVVNQANVDDGNNGRTGAPYVYLPYHAVRREAYGYDAQGAMRSVTTYQTGYSDNGDTTLSETTTESVVSSATFNYDAAGRQIRQIDSDTAGVVYDRATTLDAGGRVVSETVVQRQGSDTLRSVTYYGYGAGSTYALGQAVSASVASYKIVSGQDQYQGTTTTTNAYAWAAGPRAAWSSTTTTPASGSATSSSTTYGYGAGGRLETVTLNDGRARTVSFVNDLSGQALRRDEADTNAATGDPHELWYRFGGREIGHVGNDAGASTDYAGSIAKRGATPATGAFGNNPRYAYDFAQSVDGITSYDQGTDGGGYTVRTGDTLSGIAAQAWGDAGLWYKLAQANGLTADTQLTAGTTLRLPAGMVRSTYNAAQFRPYDPADALGDVTPVTATPAAKKAKSNKCGAFGKILLIAVAIAVTALTAGAAAAALAPVASGGTILGGLGVIAGGTALSTGALVGIGAGAGIAGSMVSQGVGLATGIQDKFSWKGVALAGIAGGVGGGLAGSFSSVGGSALLGNVARGALSNLLTQGVAIATGLQGKFDWAGIAVGGVVGGAMGAAGRGLANAGLGRFGTRLTSGMAGAIAGGAARSLIDGSDFGDNVLAALPDVIGSTIGNMIANGVAGDPNSPRRVARRADNQFEPFLSEADRSSTEFQAGRKIARAEFEADIAAARAANDPALLRLARDRYADFYASSSPGFAAELSQARTLSTGPDLSRGAQFIGLDDADTIVVTGVRPPRGVAIFPLVDPLSVEAGNIAINVGSAASAAIDRVPGGRLAVTLVDVGLAIGGGPVRYAVGKAYEAGKDGLIGYATGRFADAHYGRDARAGGVGLPVLGSILTGGVGAGLNTLSVLGGITIRNAHLAGGNHPVTGVPFDSNGFPDFSGHATHTVSIGQTGRRGVDNRAANRAAGLRREPEGYTWHHHQDGVTMQLVPTSLHGGTAHTGGVALRKKP